MKTFFATLLGVIAGAVVLAVLLAPPESLRRAAKGFAQRLRAEPDQHAQRAVRQRDESRSQRAAADELSEQRRERLALLTATLAGKPIAPLTRAEAQLFQDAERRRARSTAGSEHRPIVRLVGPVQIDEWTTLLPGTPVEFLGYNRDDVVTIAHQGARYEVAAWQAGLGVREPLPDRWSAPSVEDVRSIEYLTDRAALQ